METAVRGRSGSRERGRANSMRHVPSEWCLDVPPNEGLDVALMLSPAHSDQPTADWLLAKLTSARLIARRAAHHQALTFYITANYRTLLLRAEQMKLKKRLKPEFGGGLGTFSVANAEMFLNVENEGEFFTSQERQTLIQECINTIQAKDDEKCPADPSITFFQDQPIVALLRAKGIITDLFPLHDLPYLEVLKATWVNRVSITQPIEDIREYFGAEVAFYFSWLGYYTYWLVYPALLGTLLWLFMRNQFVTDVASVLFSMFNVVWITTFLEFWKRKSSEQAYNWGTLDKPSDLLEYPRPLFRGTREISPITNRPELFYPHWKRVLFISTVTVPTLLFSFVLVFGSMFITFELQEWADYYTTNPLIRMFPKVCLSILVALSGDIYQRVVHFLNDQENYRSEEHHRNGLIVKLGLFHFLNNFFALFYIAFYLRDMTRLSQFLAALLITRQVVGNIKEVGIPYFKYQMAKQKLVRTVNSAQEEEPQAAVEGVAKLRFMAQCVMQDASCVFRRIVHQAKAKVDRDHRGSVKSEASRTLSQAQIECEMANYDVEDMFEDYLEMFIQLGYVVFFSSAFPLAALCALVNNLFEIHVDGFKLCNSFRRPFGLYAAGIGVWQNMMEVMGVIAVLVNCSLLVASGQLARIFPGLTTVQIILIAVLIEHIALALKWAISVTIPDLPAWVAAEMAKVEFKRIQALREVELAAIRARSREVSPATRTEKTSTRTRNSSIYDQIAEDNEDKPEPDENGNTPTTTGEKKPGVQSTV